MVLWSKIEILLMVSVNVINLLQMLSHGHGVDVCALLILHNPSSSLNTMDKQTLIG